MKCRWNLDDYDSNTYKTSCSEHEFQFFTDGPIENNFKYCPYCGKEIKTRSTK